MPLGFRLTHHPAPDIVSTASGLATVSSLLNGSLQYFKLVLHCSRVTLFSYRIYFYIRVSLQDSSEGCQRSSEILSCSELTPCSPELASWGQGSPLGLGWIFMMNLQGFIQSIYCSRVTLHGSRISFYDARANLHFFRVSLHGPSVSLRTPAFTVPG